MKAKLAVVLITVIAIASYTFFAEAGMGRSPVEASGVLEEDEVIVSVPPELALLTVDEDQKQGTLAMQSTRPVGAVYQINVAPGDLVKKGDVLLRVAETEASNNLKKTQAQYDLVAATIESLSDKKSELQDKRSDLESKESTLKANRAKMVGEFNAEYSSGKANIDQMNKQLSQLKSSGADQEAIVELEAQIAQATAGLEAGKRQFNDALREIDNGLATISDAKNKIDDGAKELSDRADVFSKVKKQAKVALAMAKNIASATGVKATSSGRITNLKVMEGSVVYPGQRVASISREEKLKLDIYIPLKDIGRVKKGNPAEVGVDAKPGHAFKGEVVQIGGKAIFAPSNITTNELELVKVVKVVIEVKNEKGFLKAGMPADVKIN